MQFWCCYLPLWVPECAWWHHYHCAMTMMSPFTLVRSTSLIPRPEARDCTKTTLVFHLQVPQRGNTWQKKCSSPTVVQLLKSGTNEIQVCPPSATNSQPHSEAEDSNVVPTTFLPGFSMQNGKGYTAPCVASTSKVYPFSLWSRIQANKIDQWALRQRGGTGRHGWVSLCHSLTAVNRILTHESIQEAILDCTVHAVCINRLRNCSLTL